MASSKSYDTVLEEPESNGWTREIPLDPRGPIQVGTDQHGQTVLKIAVRPIEPAVIECLRENYSAFVVRDVVAAIREATIVEVVKDVISQ